VVATAEQLTEGLAVLAHGASGVCDSAVIAHRSDGTVVRSGAIVVKAHAHDTDSGALAARLAVAAHPLSSGILLAPLPLSAGKSPLTAVLYGRPVTAWPLGFAVDRERPDEAPWEEAAVLLARLHSLPAEALPGSLPAMRGPAKAARAIARMRAVAPEPAVLRVWERLPAWARDEAPQPYSEQLCHGDLHLGQLVRHPTPDGPWRLIDVDDLGLGVPAWDLARPAMWFAAGLLAPDVWARFLAAYRAAGGSAVAAEGDPWPFLDVPARALAAQSAALAVARAARERRSLDQVEAELVDACARIAEVS
jgi:Ser/Thr protein kinase RdoA (MazF antagonist)